MRWSAAVITPIGSSRPARGFPRVALVFCLSCPLDTPPRAGGKRDETSTAEGTRMLTKGDDYPIHQTPEPIAYSGSDRNFYDRYFFNGYSPDGSEFIAVAF